MKNFPSVWICSPIVTSAGKVMFCWEISSYHIVLAFLFFIETKPVKNNEDSLKCILKMGFRLVICASCLSCQSRGKLEWLSRDNLSSLQFALSTCMTSFYKIRSEIQGKNHWTMKYRSQWTPNSMRSLTVSNWTSIQNMMPSNLILSQIQGKITGPWNIGHSDL